MAKKNDGRPTKIVWHGRTSGRVCGCVVDEREGVEIYCEEVGAIEVSWPELPPLFMCPEHYRWGRKKGEPSIKELVEIVEWHEKS